MPLWYHPPPMPALEFVVKAPAHVVARAHGVTDLPHSVLALLRVRTRLSREGAHLVLEPVVRVAAYVRVHKVIGLPPSVR